MWSDILPWQANPPDASAILKLEFLTEADNGFGQVGQGMGSSRVIACASLHASWDVAAKSVRLQKAFWGDDTELV
jgi:hypothetical protein